MTDQLIIHVPISNRAWALHDFWKALSGQDLPAAIRERTRVVFDVNDSQDATGDMLDEIAAGPHGFGKVIIRKAEWPHVDFADHVWPPERLDRMTSLRNRALFDLLFSRAQFLFSIDSDVILTEPDTLTHLMMMNVPVVAAVFHTRWGNPRAFSLPNVWESGRYEMTEAFREKIRHAGHYQVGGLGACTLIRRDVPEAGVNYNVVYNAPSEYVGEDRFFSLRAAVAGFELMACTCKRVAHIDKGWTDPVDRALLEHGAIR